GSALLITIVLIMVMTLLGVALFDLSLVDARWGLVSEIDYKAFEVAQAGLERAMYTLYLDLCSNSSSCASAKPICDKSLPAIVTPPDCVSWAKGTIDGTAFGPAAAYTTFSLPTSSFSSAKLGEVNGTGAYTIKLRNVTTDDAAAKFSQPCKKDTT